MNSIKPTEKQFARLPKHVQDYITNLERRVESLENDPVRVNRIYSSRNGGDVPAVARLIYGSLTEEMALHPEENIRFRTRLLDQGDEHTHIDVSMSSFEPGQIRIVGSGLIDIHPCSGNMVNIISR